MESQNTPESIVLTRKELDSVLRHLTQFEKVVKEFERQESERKLAPEWHEHWESLKAFLQSEELEDSKSDDGSEQLVQLF